MNNTLIDLYSDAVVFAQENNQVVGENRDYYITLEQLEFLCKKWQKIESPEESEEV